MIPTVWHALRSALVSERKGEWDLSAPPSGVILTPLTRLAIRVIENGRVLSHPDFPAATMSHVCDADIRRLQNALGPQAMRIMASDIAALSEPMTLPDGQNDTWLWGNWRLRQRPRQWEIVYRRSGRVQLARVGRINTIGSELYFRAHVC